MNRSSLSHNNKSHISKSGEEGFTLLETLISLIILSLMIGMSFQSLATSTTKIKRSEHFNKTRVLLNDITASGMNERFSPRFSNEGMNEKLSWSISRQPIGLGVEIMTITVNDLTGAHAPLVFRQTVASPDRQ